MKTVTISTEHIADLVELYQGQVRRGDLAGLYAMEALCQLLIDTEVGEDIDKATHFYLSDQL